MSRLREIVYGTKRERVSTESTTIGGIICPLIKLQKWDVYIYGGVEISPIILWFWNLGIDIKGILDYDPQKEGKMALDKVPIIMPEKIVDKFDPQKTFVIVNIESYHEILCLFKKLGIEKFYVLSEKEKTEIKAKPHPWVDRGRIDYYREKITELDATYDSLYDKHSKEIMLEFIRTYMQFSTYRLEQGTGDKKYFWGQNADGTKEELYQHREDEVWINCGSNNGDNIFWYFANGLTAEAVYAYEADKNMYLRLVNNISYLPVDYRQKIHPINEFINSETDWGILQNKVTFINADIEGGELDLLKSLKNIIISARPVLAVCVYHKAADLVDIPDYIRSIVDDYCYVLRKYESSVENVRRAAELVLYAIPQERISATLQREI